MAAPTVVGTPTVLVEGTGTRSFAAVTTAAGDYLVVEVEVQDDNTGNYPVTATGLTFTQRLDTGTGTGIRGRILDSTAPDAAGGSRTVTITPSVGTQSYRALLTVVRGSTGPGNAAGTKTAQTLSFTRSGTNSMIFMAVMDWSTGAVGTPAWTPGGSTVSSQQGTNATYVFGRWDDSGSTGTATTGDNGTAYTTPAIGVLEMLGTTPPPTGDDGPYAVPMLLPLLSYDPLLQPTVFPMRPWQRRFAWAAEPWLRSDPDSAAAAEDHPLEVLAAAGAGAQLVAGRDTAGLGVAIAAGSVLDVLARGTSGASRADAASGLLAALAHTVDATPRADSAGGATPAIAGAFDFQLVALATAAGQVLLVATHGLASVPQAGAAGSVLAALTHELTDATHADAAAAVLDAIARTAAGISRADAGAGALAVLVGINDHILVSLASAAVQAGAPVGHLLSAAAPADVAGGVLGLVSHLTSPVAVRADTAAGSLPAILYQLTRVVRADAAAAAAALYALSSPVAAHLVTTAAGPALTVAPGGLQVVTGGARPGLVVAPGGLQIVVASGSSGALEVSGP